MALALAAPAVSAPRAPLTIPPGPLSSALSALARQAQVDIGGSDPALGRLATPGVSGRLGVEAALRRLLTGTPFDYRKLGPETYRIVARAPPSRLPRAPAVAEAAATVPAESEIVVTASKRDTPLARFAGSALVLVPSDGALGPHGSFGRNWLLARASMLQSTELGPGRNKLFIRGVADSSFSGPTQATAGTYFGDVRTGYNGPDPNLTLYDIDRVEVLEGPQGALYGAGSIGGIIRLTPRVPDLGGAAASTDTGLSLTAHGDPGYDGAGMVNLVPWRDHLALRVVAYRSVDGGFIDDPGRAVSNVNRLAVNGARAALRLASGDGWTLDGGYLAQRNKQPDLQYASLNAPPLSRFSAIEQPFDDRYRQARLILSRRWRSGLTLIATGGRVSHDTDQRYDATRTGSPAPVVYDERNRIRLTTTELRLSQTRASGFGWLVGASRLRDSTATSRAFGFIDATRDLVGVTKVT